MLQNYIVAAEQSSAKTESRFSSDSANSKANALQLQKSYHVLSSVFLRVPDETLVHEVNSLLGETWTFNKELKSDYARLFIGPHKLLAPPWESVYRSRLKLVCQESLLEVRRIYMEAGLVLNAKILEDHIGIELEFMSFLSSNNMQKLKERFVNEHLVKWVPDFCNDVMKHAETSFYKEIALFAKEIVEHEEKTNIADITKMN